MRETRDIMGMPISVEIIDGVDALSTIEAVFKYFVYIDEKFSTYKKDSEISRINRGEIEMEDYSADMKEVLELSEKTKMESGGYFDIKKPDGSLDPSGLVKGWAIKKASDIVKERGHKDYYIDAGGDIQSHGKNGQGKVWSVGIENPFNREEIVKVIYPRGKGVATSGTYIRGYHIYDPHTGEKADNGIVSITVIGPDVYDADRFATAAFAMGRDGINFIESLDDYEGYMIDIDGVATFTSGFERFLK